ncbi:hypothetical protein evm_001257 [Chilo suppressalis]|nr:hypothetical protein evm_001257 [Chilo suppressalis]
MQKNFCQPSLPPLRCPDGTLAHKLQEKADLLAKLFAANSRIDNCNALPPSLPHCGTTMPDIKIMQREVRVELQSLDVRKASGPDGIPAVILKKCAAELSPVLTRLYQCSYSLGRVPETWRDANVRPVPKKGDRSDPAIYRPIAITSVLCKVLEKVLNNHLTRYLEDHSLINDRQYGFRPKRLTGDLLAYLTHIWGEAIDKRLAISLDIAKAFDRVWHKSLLSKLPAYGLKAQFCSCVADFLHERRIRVLTDGSSSRFMSVNAGVPQGSVLFPTLFLLHIKDLIPLGNIHCYADDSTVHAGYLGQAVAGQAVTKEKRENLVIELNQALDHISVGGTTLELESSITMLDMEIRCDLNPKNYIESVIKTASRKLRVLNKVRRFFTPEQLCLLYKTQVRSCVEYCSHLWDDSAKLLDALDRLQRRAIRIIGDEEVTKHLEPLQLRRDVASLSAFDRLYHGESSEELFSLIPPSPFLQRTTRAGLRCHRLTVATIPTRTKKFGDSFICRTIRKWNALPAHVFPPSYNLGSFKRGVKKQLAGWQGEDGWYGSKNRCISYLRVWTSPSLNIRKKKHQSALGPLSPPNPHWVHYNPPIRAQSFIIHQSALGPLYPPIRTGSVITHQSALGPLSPTNPHWVHCHPPIHAGSVITLQSALGPLSPTNPRWQRTPSLKAGIAFVILLVLQVSMGDGDHLTSGRYAMFNEKVVLITGASSGIGAATAPEFAKLGACLVLTGRNKENLDEVSKQCENLSPRKLKPLVVIGDINNESDVENIIKQTLDHYSRLDILVNNAGILESGSIETTSLAQYDRVMNTNVRGPYQLTMLAAPHLVKTRGNIVNVSSVTGLRSFPNVLAYCMSKSALDQFTRCVSLELASKGVRVNAVNPGVIDTGIHMKSTMNEQQYQEFLIKCKETHAIGRAGSAKEVASVIVFLADDRLASNITGATIPVDGGRHAMCPR